MTTSDNPPSSVRLRDLAAQVSRRWVVLVASIALVTAASLGAGALMQKQYTAAASLTVSPLTTNPFSTAAVNQQVNINTERAILKSKEVARLASEQLGIGAAGPTALLRQVDVAAPSGSQVLEVSVTMPDPQQAADYANAMAGAYLKFRAEGAAELASGYVAALSEEIARLSAIEKPTDQQAQRLSEAIQQRQNLTLVADSPGRIIGVASPPSQPSSMRQLSFLISGLIGGILVGLVAALMRERTDKRVRTRSRLSEACSGPALEVADKDDAEGMRWVLRTLSPVITGQQSGPALVGVMPAFSKSSSPSEFAEGLAEAARTAGLSVLVVRPADIDPAKIDQGWPESVPSNWHHRDLVILDTSHRLRGARRASLADHLDAVVILAYADTSLEDLRQLESDLDRSSAVRVPVLLGNLFNKEFSQGQGPVSLLPLPPSAAQAEEADATERREFA